MRHDRAVEEARDRLEQAELRQILVVAFRGGPKLFRFGCCREYGAPHPGRDHIVLLAKSDEQRGVDPADALERVESVAHQAADGQEPVSLPRDRRDAGEGRFENYGAKSPPGGDEGSDAGAEALAIDGDPAVVDL